MQFGAFRYICDRQREAARRLQGDATTVLNEARETCPRSSRIVLEERMLRAVTEWQCSRLARRANALPSTRAGRGLAWAPMVDWVIRKCKRVPWLLSSQEIRDETR